MRLWHKDLIKVLPRQQLLGQWRECCLISKQIMTKGTPNHLLVNRIMDYPLSHFYTYSMMIYDEMARRGYNPDRLRFIKWMSGENQTRLQDWEIFHKWHNKCYLKQCLYNLEEKYDCGGITREEWYKIRIMFGKFWR